MWCRLLTNGEEGCVVSVHAALRLLSNTFNFRADLLSCDITLCIVKEDEAPAVKPSWLLQQFCLLLVTWRKQLPFFFFSPASVWQFHCIPNWYQLGMQWNCHTLAGEKKKKGNCLRHVTSNKQNCCNSQLGLTAGASSSLTMQSVISHDSKSALKLKVLDSSLRAACTETTQPSSPLVNSLHHMTSN